MVALFEPAPHSHRKTILRSHFLTIVLGSIFLLANPGQAADLDAPITLTTADALNLVSISMSQACTTQILQSDDDSVFTGCEVVLSDANGNSHLVFGFSLKAIQHLQGMSPSQQMKFFNSMRSKMAGFSGELIAQLAHEESKKFGAINYASGELDRAVAAIKANNFRLTFTFKYKGEDMVYAYVDGSGVQFNPNAPTITDAEVMASR